MYARISSTSTTSASLQRRRRYIACAVAVALVAFTSSTSLSTIQIGMPGVHAGLRWCTSNCHLAGSYTSINHGTDHYDSMEMVNSGCIAGQTCYTRKFFLIDSARIGSS